MLGPKKNSYKKFDSEKNHACGSKIPLHHPPPPHNFSNGPFLMVPFP